MMMEGGQGPREKLGFFSGAHSGGIGGRGGRDKDDSLSSSPSLTPSPPAPPSLTVAAGPPLAPVMGMAGISSVSGSSSGSGEDEMVGKKRWRPTEGGGHEIGGYGSAAATASISLSLSSAPPPAAATSAAIAMTKPLSFDVSSSSAHKRSRGRPPGSGRRQLLSTFGEWFAYSAGGNFTPHVVTVAAGEDVAARIMSFSQKGPRTICILSANGTISNVTLRQPGSSGGTLTFEGRFELLSLSGSFSITEDGGVRSRTGGISVSLAGPDGRVVGGGVAGLLLAASPIQLVVGSFLPNTCKEHKRRTNPESSSFSPIPTSSLLTAAKPIAQANPNDDCETPTSAVAAQNRHEEQKSTIGSANPTYNHSTGGWHGLQQSSTEHKPSPDINISLPAE